MIIIEILFAPFKKDPAILGNLLFFYFSIYFLLLALLRRTETFTFYLLLYSDARLFLHVYYDKRRFLLFTFCFTLARENLYFLRVVLLWRAKTFTFCFTLAREGFYFLLFAALSEARRLCLTCSLHPSIENDGAAC